MFFRNLTIYRFPAVTAYAFRDLLAAAPEGSGLQKLLRETAAKPVGPMEMSSRGWVAPMGLDAMYHDVGDAIWITLGGEDRILPASVVNSELAKRIADVEESDGRRLGGKARKRIKDDVVAELLPRALVKPYRLNAYLDLRRGFIAVDTSSRKQADGLVGELRHALGSFPALPLNAEVSPRAVLTGWLSGEPLPEDLWLGDECELREGVDRGAVVKCQRQELQSEETRQHLEAGKQCTRMSLQLDDHVAFTFGEDLVVRKLRFLDGAVESLEQVERDSLAAELDARFALMSAEIARLFEILAGAFRFTQAEG